MAHSMYEGWKTQDSLTFDAQIGPEMRDGIADVIVTSLHRKI